jgi:hypothetical protein
MLRQREMEVLEDQLHERLYPVIEARVFHVTRRENVAAILTDGGISPNPDGAFLTTFGSSSNSFFRNRGCVSLFDLVHPTAEQIESRLRDCWPFLPARPGSDIALFLLSPAAYGEIIPWTRYREEGGGPEMIVPYVEAGFPGVLPMRLVEEIIEVHVLEAPDSLQALHRRLSTGGAKNGAV